MSALPYETQLRASFDRALRESSAHFAGASAVVDSLRRLAERLDAEGIPYALIGALALGAHGYLRMTADIDLVMTAEGLEAFRARLVGRGYRPAFEGAQRSFRDVASEVRIEVVESGAFPGDGLPKPIAFPDPGLATTVGTLRVLPLELLIALKLASGLSAPGRLKDLADVQELIRARGLPLDLADSLDPSVAPEYRRLWQALHAGPDPFEEQPGPPAE